MILGLNLCPFSPYILKQSATRCGRMQKEGGVDLLSFSRCCFQRLKYWFIGVVGKVYVRIMPGTVDILF